MVALSIHQLSFWGYLWSQPLGEGGGIVAASRNISRSANILPHADTSLQHSTDNQFYFVTVLEAKD